jgi:transcriptional antiterminator RfaH
VPEIVENQIKTNGMFLTATELSLESARNGWFCLRARPKREHIAAACLRQNREVHVFNPRVRFRKRTNRGPVWFVESMFPGYLFARFDYAASHRLVRQGRGVNGFVQFGDRFGLLPDELIAELKAQVGKSELLEINQQFVPGQNVLISQGPFQGLEALVTRFIVAKDRVEILIEWMGRSVRAESNPADLSLL